MKVYVLVFALMFVFFEKGDIWAKCPSCPEKKIKREVSTKTQKEKGLKKRGGSVKIVKLQENRKKPPIAEAKSSFPDPISHILEKEKEVILPDGTLLRLITEEDLKPMGELPE